MNFVLRGGMIGGGCNCDPRKSCDHTFKMRDGIKSFKKSEKKKKQEEKKKKY